MTTLIHFSWFRTRRWSSIFLLSFASFSCLLGNSVTAMSSSSLASGSGAFALDVYNVLRKGEQGNIFFSPFSITSAFGMVYAGAGSSTKDEMTKAMRLPFDDQSKNLGAFQDLLPKIKGDGSVTLDTANRVYVQDGAKILDDYMAALKKHFQNTVESANFGDDAQRVKINAWVEEQTRNKIKDLLPSGSLNALTRLVVVNAVYFKGNWAKQFDPQQTKAMPFHLSSSNNVDVPMMMKKTHYNVYDVKGLKADIVEIPYQGDAMSMVLIIPKEVDGLKEVEAGLTHDVLATITTPKPRSRELTLYLPKFKLETSFKLKAPLAELGMKSLFDQSEADLSGITGDKSLYVSEGYHKAFLEVNEEGTEAAAATGVVMMLRAMPMNIVVKADRPFLLLIKEKATGTVLFMGNLVDPRA